MILCSKIAFLNVLTQLLNTKQIVEATYYVPDSTALDMKRGMNMKLTDRVKFNEYGQLVHEVGTINTASSMSNAQIHSYCPSLDPLAYTTSLLDGIDGYDNPVDRYVNTCLKKDTTLNAIYDFIIKQPPRDGNGERIIVYEHYQSLWEFGYVIAEYLSTYFGFDIIYLDRIYNQYIRGEKKYFGNKENARKTIQVCQDRELVNGVTNAMSGTFGMNVSYSSDETLNSLTVYLNCLKWEKLKRLYELLFPNEPLPNGSYTETRMREILTGKLMDRCRSMFGGNNDFPNTGVIPSDYEEAINDMDDLKYMY